MKKEKVKRIWKEHWKDITVGAIGITLVALGVKTYIDISKTPSNAEWDHIMGKLLENDDGTLRFLCECDHLMKASGSNLYLPLEGDDLSILTNTIVKDPSGTLSEITGLIAFCKPVTEIES